jgi:hypothetical protein
MRGGDRRQGLGGSVFHVQLEGRAHRDARRIGPILGEFLRIRDAARNRKGG